MTFSRSVFHAMSWFVFYLGLPMHVFPSVEILNPSKQLQENDPSVFIQVCEHPAVSPTHSSISESSNSE